MEIISRFRIGDEGVWKLSLLFTDNGCGSVGFFRPCSRLLLSMLRVSSFKSEAMFLSWKNLDCPFWVEGRSLPQAEELKYFGMLFTSDYRM